MNRDAGLEEAINAVGGVGALARALGIAQPSVSNWSRIPAERVLAIESLTGVARSVLRPDLYPGEADLTVERDEVDQARGRCYALLAALLLRPADAALLAQIARLEGDLTPLGSAVADLAEAAGPASSDSVKREFFDLFIGVARGELMPYASYYLTGFLQDRPLAKLRDDLRALGLERADGHAEPEDHIGSLCEVMSGFAEGRFLVSPEEEQRFFSRHLANWADRFFGDLERAKAARFYKAVGQIGRIFMDVEAQAFQLIGTTEPNRAAQA